MINKEDIEKGLKEWLNEEIVNTYAEGKAKKLNAVLQYISELEEDNKRQKEINKEHQKLNGELQEKLTRYKIKNEVLTEIIEGKTIRELGTSDLYKEETKDECSRNI